MRRPSLESLAQDTFDVVVIGGGVNGASAAQQLASRGYRVLVVDKGDFAEGATSRSSRILHCGLRHLAPGTSAWEFARHPLRFLVACQNARKSMISQHQVAQTMGKLVRPFKFCVPIYKDGPYASWQMDAGFQLLKILGPRGHSLDYVRHRKETMDEVPYVRWLRDRDQLQGIAVFRDYQFVTAERVVIDTLKDACQLGAVARNYSECRGATRVGDEWKLTLSDSLAPDASVTVRAKLVINATGPWVDRTTAKLTGDQQQRMVGLKGIHLMVHLPRELADWGLMAITREGETLYCLPWNGMHYIGPTRTPYGDNLDEVAATAEEVAWVLAETNHALPALRLTRADILFSWAGIQPVSFDKSEPKGTRAVKIHDLAALGSPNMLILTGGPIMTFRIIGKDLADAVAQRVDPSERPRQLSHEASEVSARLDDLDPTTSLDRIPDELVRDIVREEQVLNLTDLFLRRTRAGYEHDQGCHHLEATAEVVAGVLGWNQQRTRKEVETYRAYLRHTFPNGRDD